MSPGQLTKVNYSLFCKCILLSNKYFSWFCKKTDPLELQLGMVVSHHVGTGN